MGLTTAERNRRKRERKKKEREERRKQEQKEKLAQNNNDNDANEKSQDGNDVGANENSAGVAALPKDVEIEYVAEPIMPADAMPEGVPVEPESMESVLRRFHQRAAVAAVVTDDERGASKSKTSGNDNNNNDDDDDDDNSDDEKKPMSKRKLREVLRPSVAELKRKVKRPDLVEAHDITAADPAFLVYLKAIPGSVPVPRHWGRKRKYLQGKRGFEKQPFQLPDFIVKTGITEIRDTVAEDEAKMSAKQKNRSRVAPKMGAIDVDYKVLHEAFFKHQTKPTNLTKFGDLYYEGKELETQTDIKPGGPLSKNLREALGMVTEKSPPPWLVNMQRYGPPPSYPNLAIPGLNAPLPSDDCQYGYHAGGWGKPPVDHYGRPLYGGNPFDPPGSGKRDNIPDSGFVTNDGKTVTKDPWGGLPMAYETPEEYESDDDEESSGGEMEESSEEEEGEEEEEPVADGIESVLPPPTLPSSTAPGNLRKEAGDETPFVDKAPKQLYQVLQETKTTSQSQAGTVFASEVQYVVPGTTPKAAAVPEGAESVLSKAIAPNESNKRKKKQDVDDDEDLGKNFKF